MLMPAVWVRIWPIVMRGDRLANGSWNTYCMRRRCTRNCAGDSLAMSVSPIITSPAVGSISRRIERPIVVLPDPDSPTRPTTSPRGMSNEMSLSTVTVGPLENAAGLNCLLSPRTDRKGVVMAQTSAQWMQRALRPAPTSISAGIAARHASVT